jgi:hypothetical protein
MDHQVTSTASELLHLDVVDYKTSSTTRRSRPTGCTLLGSLSTDRTECSVHLAAPTGGKDRIGQLIL